MEMRDIFFFDKMLTPTIVTFVYWFILVAAVIGGLVTMFSGDFFYGLVTIVGGVAVRPDLVRAADRALQDERGAPSHEKQVADFEPCRAGANPKTRLRNNLYCSMSGREDAPRKLTRGSVSNGRDAAA